jgi:hypothetical protein
LLIRTLKHSLTHDDTQELHVDTQEFQQIVAFILLPHEGVSKGDNKIKFKKSSSSPHAASERMGAVSRERNASKQIRLAIVISPSLTPLPKPAGTTPGFLSCNF